MVKPSSASSMKDIIHHHNNKNKSANIRHTDHIGQVTGRERGRDANGERERESSNAVQPKINAINIQNRGTNYTGTQIIYVNRTAPTLL